ncbi:hypothetical protein B0H10DRAFT_1414458 [Mycena sp. CBHHK59/15]|nr:hypothetical protein B0H10DRAFT_1414458 [Mycena sp. CBHHK59/15]
MSSTEGTTSAPAKLSQSEAASSSGHSSSVTFSSSSFPSPQDTSSFAISSSRVAPTISSLPRTSMASSSSTIQSTTRPFTSLSSAFSHPALSSSGQMSPQPSANSTQVDAVSSSPHQSAIIAGTAVSASVVLVVALIACLYLYRRRRKAHNQRKGINYKPQIFLVRTPTQSDDTERRSSANGWSQEPDPWCVSVPDGPRTRRSTASVAKAPHYTVRSHASISDVYGFGQDAAWQDARYVDALPIVPAVPPHIDSEAYPSIDVVPPTPPSAALSHTTPLLRSHSAASSIASTYSTASMVLPPASAHSDFP